MQMLPRLHCWVDKVQPLANQAWCIRSCLQSCHSSRTWYSRWRVASVRLCTRSERRSLCWVSERSPDSSWNRVGIQLCRHLSSLLSSLNALNHLRRFALRIVHQSRTYPCSVPGLRRNIQYPQYDNLYCLLCPDDEARCRTKSFSLL